MLVKDQKALDILALNESEASELIEMADTYRKSFASKVKENEINIFILSLEEPTDKDITKLLGMLKNMDIELDESELKENIHTIITQQKKHKKQLDKLGERFKQYSHLETRDVEIVNATINRAKKKYLKLDDISAELKIVDEKLKDIEKQKPASLNPELEKEIDIFLKNFINPTKEDVRDFIDFLEDRYEISDKEKLVDRLMHNGKTQLHDKKMMVKMMSFERSCDKIDDAVNVMEKYKAIRNIYGISKDDKELLKWLQYNHYPILKKTAEKLLLNISEGIDESIANESRLLLNILKPFLKTNDKTTPDKWICPGCGKGVDAEWKLCPNCGENLIHKHCSKCGNKLESSWKLCPNCGKDIS
ncbi:MAG: zinc ribbon domain-containing protein [Methanosarcinales archaeon]|nr:zinc ribbon domain-containing protein [ANME-2 cluster archaeon]MDW7776218.1 zinc ribbon domain-containing protein [Methanosarcinales archaeon]